jgi:hypothetical protein
MKLCAARCQTSALPLRMRGVLTVNKGMAALVSDVVNDLNGHESLA